MWYFVTAEQGHANKYSNHRNPKLPPSAPTSLSHKYLRRGGGVGDLRRRGGGAGEGERRLLAGGGEGLLLRLPRGEASFWRFRGDGEALRAGECLRRLPTSPFFTWDLLGRSSSEEEEEPESDEDCWFCRLYSVSSSTSSLTFPKKILSSNTEEILSFSTSKEKNSFAPSPS